jgi:NAD(P)-dependent dehydrogenase (short-subunit alcohol dehydrogenase family)
MAYELEPFSIKVILVEPGFIKTNFGNAAVIAKKAQDSASPYTDLMQNMMASTTELAKNASSAELVANIILDAASDPNPRLRYLAGKDVEAWAASKKNLEELEFFNMMKSLTA